MVLAALKYIEPVGPYLPSPSHARIKYIREDINSGVILLTRSLLIHIPGLDEPELFPVFGIYLLFVEHEPFYPPYATSTYNWSFTTLAQVDPRSHPHRIAPTQPRPQPHVTQDVARSVIQRLQPVPTTVEAPTTSPDSTSSDNSWTSTHANCEDDPDGLRFD